MNIGIISVSYFTYAYTHGTTKSLDPALIIAAVFTIDKWWPWHLTLTRKMVDFLFLC